MITKHIGISVHLLAFIVFAGILPDRFSFFGLFTSIVQNNFLHLLHTSLVIHFLYVLSNSLSTKAFGSLTSSEQSEYNDKIYSMFSELVMIVSFFPRDLEMVNILYFALLFSCKSFSWIYTIKAQRLASTRMLVCGLITATAAGAAAYCCWVALGSKFSITVLLALEYSLILISNLRTSTTTLYDLMGPEQSRSFYIFIISIAYYSSKAVVILAFIILVTLHNRFPVNSARSLIYTLSKLRKKIQLFRAYIQLCCDLDTIEEVPIDGTCAICTESLERGKVLECKHAFHADCLKMWCEHEQNCPICRSNLIVRHAKVVITEDEILTGIPIDVE